MWKEIQQYLRHLCLSNPAAQELAAKTAAESMKQSSKTKGPPSMKTPSVSMKPSPGPDKKKQKRKTKSTQVSPYPESIHERRQQLLRLQAEKQQEHAMVVAQLREQVIHSMIPFTITTILGS